MKKGQKIVEMVSREVPSAINSPPGLDFILDVPIERKNVPWKNHS